jgi:hypothetical protein
MGTEDVESRQPARVRVFDYLAQRAAELSIVLQYRTHMETT